MTGRLLGVIAVVCVAGCRGGTAATPNGSYSSAFTVAVEGNCAKLQVHEAGSNTVLVFGTYGLDEAGAWTGQQTAHGAQALALVRERSAAVDPVLLDGLPHTSRGWIDGDVDVGGGGQNGFWLERVVRTPAAINQGALFEVSHDGFSWSMSGKTWQPSAGRDAFLRGPRTTLPVATLFCESESRAFSLLASERGVDGTTFIAGRCEDELHRPSGPLLLARWYARTNQWERIASPASPLLEGPDAIVNAGIVVVSAEEAWVHAYRPFGDSEHGQAYLAHVTGERASAALVPTPFEGSIVSLARAKDGTLWAVAGFKDLRRRDAAGKWDSASVALPQLSFVEPIPSSVRLLEVQTTGKDVWVHGAVPTIKADGSPSREHVLFTTTPWSTTLHCDREQAPRAALGRSTSKVKLAMLRNSKEKPE